MVVRRWGANVAVKEDPPAGVPEWIVTYGDMMSLLLTFFIMLVSLSELKGDKKYQAMIESIMKHLGFNSAPVAPHGDAFPLSGMLQKLTMLGGSTMRDKIARGGTINRATPGPDVRVFTGREGAGVSVGSALMFEPGQAELSPLAQSVLQEVVTQIAGKPNKVEIRGLATSNPLEPGSPFPDRLTLTYRRAKSVMNLLVDAGVRTDRLRIGIARFDPTLSLNDQVRADERIEIFVLDAYASEFVGVKVGMP